jgi:hypothetical protein
MYEEGCYAILVYLALCGVSGRLGVPAVLQSGYKLIVPIRKEAEWRTEPA